MFAVADWMKMKNSEEARKVKYEKSINPPPIRESLARLKENKQIRVEISSKASLFNLYCLYCPNPSYIIILLYYNFRK